MAPRAKNHKGASQPSSQKKASSGRKPKQPRQKKVGLPNPAPTQSSSSRAEVSSKSTMDPVALLRGLEVAPSFTNRGSLRAATYGSKTNLTRAVSQFLNPLGGALQRLPPGSSGQMSMTPTAMASTHQVLRYQIPADYATIPSGQQPLLLTSMDSGGVATYIPLYDFSQGCPIIHFWDPATPAAYPTFAPSPSVLAYVATSFANLLQNKVVGISDQNGAQYTLAVKMTPLVPRSLAVNSVDQRGGLYRPQVKIGENICFWCDNGTTVSYRVVSTFGGTFVSGFVIANLWHINSSGEPQMVYEDSAPITGTGSAQTLNTLAHTSGWHFVTITASVTTSTVPSAACEFAIDQFTTTTTNRQVHTAFLTNTAYVDNISLIQSDRLLGTSLQAYSSSPVLQVGGRILASVGHVYNGDFRLALSNLSKSVNNSPNCSFYDGPLLTQGSADGGIYSIVCPRRAFIMQDVDSVSNPSESGRSNYVLSDLVANGENNFGYNIIVFRPSFADGASTMELEMVFAQSTEYSTASQFLFTEKSKMSQVEMLQLLDIVRGVQPFCANPFHLKMVKEFLSKAANAVREGAGMAARSIPYASKIATVLGHPEIAAVLNGVASTAGSVHNILGS